MLRASGPPPAELDDASPGAGALEARALGGWKKRAFDIAFSLAFLIMASPLLLLIALAVKLFGKGPILYRHERIGFAGEPFSCLKFRTMRCNGDLILADHLRTNAQARDEFARTHKLKEDPRIIRGIGKLLRQSSLDELPQFINVLRGDMSVVGPRPITLEELPAYGTTQKAYLSTRPGITGLWQVSGRNRLTFQERVAIDARYIRSWGFSSDLIIVLRTVPVVLSRDGAQ